MSYIGNTPTQQNFVAGADQFSGNGSTTAFTLSRNVNTVFDIFVAISNVPQDPYSAYSVSGNTLTFTSAPPSGTGNIYVVYRATNVQTFVPTQGVSPSFGNLTYTGTLTGSTGVVNIGSGQVYKDASGNVGIGTSSPVAGARLAVVGGGTQISGGTSAQEGFRFQRISGAATISGINNDNNAYNDIAMYAGASEGARLTTGNNFQFNSGYGSVATAYGCRAWVSFNNTTINASGNVSSVANNTNAMTINFTNAMPDANYSFIGNGRTDTINTGNLDFPLVAAYRANTVLTGSLKISSVFRSSATNTATFQLGDITTIAIFR